MVLGSNFRMKSFKYENGGLLQTIGPVFICGFSNYFADTEKGKTAYDPVNEQMIDASLATLPVSNCQVSVDLSNFKPYLLRKARSMFQQLYTHNLDLSSLDLSKCKDFEGMFSQAIITGNLKLFKIDDSHQETPNAIYFTGENEFQEHQNSESRISTLKKALRFGEFKRLNWQGAPLRDRKRFSK